MKAVGRIVSANEARNLVNNYACGQCWNRLIDIYLGDEKSFVFCSNENCNANYFHSKKGIELARQMDRSNAIEARYNLREILHNPQEGKSVEELLNELGY